MKKIIIYGSQYGSSERYARELSKITGIRAVESGNAQEAADADLVIHMGALYAGGVKGLKQTMKHIRKGTKLIVITVGIADVRNEINVKNIRRSLASQMPENVYQEATLFHLRGDMDYSRMNRKHRLMMGFMYRSLKKKPAEQQSDEDRAVIETYGKSISFYDPDTVKPIAQYIISHYGGNV